MEYESPPDVRGARVDGLVDERWCPPEVAHILEVDVLGIGFGLLGVQVGVSQVAVGESVGCAFEENDNGVHFAEGTDTWVVDIIVHVFSSDVEIRNRVDAVEESNRMPRRIEALQCCRILLGCVFLLFRRDLCMRSFCLPRRNQLDEVRYEEMCRDKEVQEQACDYVRTSIIMATNADKDAVLLNIHYHQPQVGDDCYS